MACAFVTNSSLCAFDIAPGACGATADSTFRLILTPDVQLWPAYKLNSSNPGQYYYNMIAEGTPGEDETFTITIPTRS